MTTPEDKIGILLVDDNRDTLLTLEAVLSDLGQNLVKAHSGREALRCLMAQEFAVILLDINMPGLDGFETAALIRQRRTLAETPIIFVTAFGDELHAARGYELGAVDYISVPFIPEVLRTKVRVFVELFKKTREVRRQAESLRLRAAQLHRLTAASMSINGALTTERTLRVVADSARELMGAEQAAATLKVGEGTPHTLHVTSVSEGLADSHRHKLQPDGGGYASLVCQNNKPMRLSSTELTLDDGGDGPFMRGWLAAPLSSRDGRNFGLIQVSSRSAGEFTEEDQAVLVQLAQLASVAIENAAYAREREVNRIKDEFLGTLSHELRTPLAAILGWTQLLRERGVPDVELSHGLQVIERNARAQTKLIEDLLDVSRISTGKLALNKKPTAVASLVRGAVEAMQVQADAKGVSLSMSIGHEQVEVLGDPDRLQQVVQNLLSNALKFTPRGGRVGVVLERVGGRARLVVTDTGRGIHGDFLPHVFDRFRQADSTSTRSHGGLGIGLTIVRHIVELHEGTVAAESPGEGYGATFTVDLPLLEIGRRRDARRVVPLASAETGPTELPFISGTRVLVVDDEPDTRELLAQVLQTRGAHVVIAGSAREALAALDAETFDVLVSDIAMPDEDGYALMRHIRLRPHESGGAIPGVALTAYTREEDRVRALAAGFNVHLGKPVEPEVLLATVARLADQNETVAAEAPASA